MRTLRWCARIFLALPLTVTMGCASIVNGTSQTLSVATIADGKPLPGAQCALKSGKGTWFVTTPGTVTVHRAYGALNIKCTHDGFIPALITSKSSTKGMAFGNILFGGIIGAGVDMEDGAAYSYPQMIKVPMTRQPAASASPPADVQNTPAG